MQDEEEQAERDMAPAAVQQPKKQRKKHRQPAPAPGVLTTPVHVLCKSFVFDNPCKAFRTPAGRNMHISVRQQTVGCIAAEPEAAGSSEASEEEAADDEATAAEKRWAYLRCAARWQHVPWACCVYCICHVPPTESDVW